MRWLLTVCVSFTLGVACAATLFAYSSRIPIPLKASPTREASDLLSNAGKTIKDSIQFQQRLESREINIADAPERDVAAREPVLPEPEAQDGQGESQPVPVVATTPKELSYFIQAGSFADTDSAADLVAELGGLGMEASVREVSDAAGGTLHRVLVGPFDKAGEAESARASLAILGRESTLLRLSAQ